LSRKWRQNNNEKVEVLPELSENYRHTVVENSVSSARSSIYSHENFHALAWKFSCQSTAWTTKLCRWKLGCPVCDDSVCCYRPTGNVLVADRHICYLSNNCRSRLRLLCAMIHLSIERQWLIVYDELMNFTIVKNICPNSACNTGWRTWMEKRA